MDPCRWRARTGRGPTSGDSPIVLQVVVPQDLGDIGHAHGIPGWPDCAASTASMASARMAFASRRRGGLAAAVTFSPVGVIGCFGWFRTMVRVEGGNCRLRRWSPQPGIDLVRPPRQPGHGPSGVIFQDDQPRRRIGSRYVIMPVNLGDSSSRAPRMINHMTNSMPSAPASRTYSMWGQVDQPLGVSGEVVQEAAVELAVDNAGPLPVQLVGHSAGAEDHHPRSSS